MSFLDRVTKAVGEAVDRGKKEVDQFMRIQKINSQIGEIDKKIKESRAQIEQTKLQAGDMALGMLHAGTLASAEMQSLADHITGIEQKIAAEEAAIAEKRVEIEQIKAEGKSEMTTSASSAESSTPSSVPAPGETPPAAPTGRFCTHCGTAVSGSGAFCPNCGTKLA